MTSAERLTLFYLFPKDDDIKIVGMTDEKAVGLWKQGEHWLDIPQKTRQEAERLRLQLLAQQSHRI